VGYIEEPIIGYYLKKYTREKFLSTRDFQNTGANIEKVPGDMLKSWHAPFFGIIFPLYIKLISALRQLFSPGFLELLVANPYLFLFATQ